MGGHITTEYTFWCHNCREYTQIGADSRERAVGHAENLGWTKDIFKGWTCPDCVAGYSRCYKKEWSKKQKEASRKQIFPYEYSDEAKKIMKAFAELGTEKEE